MCVSFVHTKRVNRKSDEKTVVREVSVKGGKKMFRVLTFFFVSLEKRRHGEQFFFVLKSG